MIELARGYHGRTLRSYTEQQLTSKQYEQKELEREAMMSHLKWMCREIMEGRVSGSKARAWVGYIQGELRAAGIFSIEQMRYQSREALGIEYVAGFMFFDGIDVALVRKSKPAWQAGKLNGVGGKVEEGETAIEAMVREFKEETVVLSDVGDWQHFATLHTKGNRIHFFRSDAEKLWDFKSLPEEPVNWYAIDDVVHHQQTIPNLGWLIPMARIQKQLACPAEVWE